MANYLDKDSLAGLDEYRHKIFALRAEAYQKYKIDVLDNDTLSALSIYEIVSEYDSDYNINFARNGEDSKSNNVLIEQKASRIAKKKKSGQYPTASFQFHAKGNIEYNRYIFATRDLATLELIRIYDISNEKNTKLIQQDLLNKRANWEAKNLKLGYTQKYDVILLDEEFLQKLEASTKQIINGVEVIQA